MNIRILGSAFQPAIAMSAFVVALFAAPAAHAATDLGKDNAALLQHIKTTDFVFRAVLGNCSNEHVVRFRRHGLLYFTYSATCAINPLPDEDCGYYKVSATGTIDTPENATVRDTRLELLCSG
jgi:hypothetical protein